MTHWTYRIHPALWHRYNDARRWLCERGLHWPIRWSDSAYPGSYDPPHPPEPGFCCDWCGHQRDPYRAWWWDLKRHYYRWRGWA